jgi:hypothetical protein
MGTDAVGATADSTVREATSGDPDVALRAREDIEQVAVEAVHVGDYVLLEPRSRPVSARCVIAKRANVNERTARIVGWLFELTGGQVAWWPRGAQVWRGRLGVNISGPGAPASSIGVITGALA